MLYKITETKVSKKNRTYLKHNGAIKIVTACDSIPSSHSMMPQYEYAMQ